jgi:hypothetical protein
MVDVAMILQCVKVAHDGMRIAIVSDAAGRVMLADDSIAGF